MSDGDRSGLDKALIGSIVTAIAVIGLYWAMFYDAGYQSGRHQERAQIERKHYAADTSKRVEAECSGKLAVALRECVTEIVASEHENKRDESDLAAQWQAADWVFWASIIAGAQLVATVIGLYFIKGTLDATLKAVEDTGKATVAMQRQNEIAEEGMEVQSRAWLNIKVLGLPAMIIENGEPIIKGMVAIKNIGTTPAMQITWMTSFVSKDSGIFEVMGLQEYYNEEMFLHENTLFPEDRIEKPFRSALNRTEHFTGNIHDGVSLVLTVFYKTVFSDTVRCTAHIYDISDRKSPDGWVDLSQPLAANALNLTPSEDHVGFAD